MDKSVKFLAVYIVGIGVAIACLLYGGVIGFTLLGVVGALLFEGLKPAYLLNPKGLSEEEPLAEELALSEKRKREMVWSGAIDHLNHSQNPEFNNNDSRDEFEFNWQMYLTAIARLSSLGKIESDFASKSLWIAGKQVNPEHRERLLNLFILALYEERLPDFFGECIPQESTIKRID